MRSTCRLQKGRQGRAGSGLGASAPSCLRRAVGPGYRRGCRAAVVLPGPSALAATYRTRRIRGFTRALFYHERNGHLLLATCIWAWKIPAPYLRAVVSDRPLTVAIRESAFGLAHQHCHHRTQAQCSALFERASGRIALHVRCACHPAQETFGRQCRFN